MKNWLAILLSLLVVLCIICCNILIKSDISDNSENGNFSSESELYKVKTVSRNNGSIELEYPELIGDNSEYSVANSLIISILEEKLENMEHIVFGNVKYMITYQSEELVCILFEGELSGNDAPHSTNVVFPVCISLKENKEISQNQFFSLNNNFLKLFREQLKTNPDEQRFTNEEWSNISSYITAYSNEELQKIISYPESTNFILANDSIIVLFPVPHAIGDYLKIVVPYLWQCK